MTIELEWLEPTPNDSEPLVCGLCGALVDRIGLHETWHKAAS